MADCDIIFSTKFTFKGEFNVKTRENAPLEATSTRFNKPVRPWQAFEFRGGKFTDVENTRKIHIIAVEQIIPSPSQPRQSFNDALILSLADSIRNHGIINPITVRRSTKNKELFEIIAGERRLKAAKLLEMSEIPCIIADADELESAEMSIIENIQREDLNFFEEAAAIAALIKSYGLTQAEAAERLSVSQPYVANKLRILRLTDEERQKILKSELSERHARALLQISSPSERLHIIDYVSSHNLNVAATEAYIERLMSEKTVPRNESFSKRAVLKDIRVFYNSVDRAISTIKQAGIPVESERTEENGVTVLTIRIANNVSRETL